jgi:hypothetical protein
VRKRDGDLKRHQRSVRVFLDMTAQKPRKIYGDSHYSRMLVDDVANGLVPYRRAEDFGFSVEPNNAEVEQVITEGLGRDRYGRDLTGAVREFLRDAGQTLFAFGEAPYEVVYYSQGETQQLVGFDLSFVAPWTLKRGSGGWVQTVPKDYSQQIASPSRIDLASDSIVHLQFPPSINRYFSRMMTDVEALGRDMYPEFGIPTPGSSAADLGFDFQMWHRSHAIALAEATRECGWLARSLFAKNVSEFYFVRRFLEFERFKVELRTSLLSQLNEILQPVGKRIGFSARITTHGLPDLEQIDKSLMELESGTASVSDVMKPY